MTLPTPQDNNENKEQPVAEVPQAIEKKLPFCPWIGIFGHQGMGKTTLAASGTGGYVFDTEGKAFQFPNEMRRTYEYNVGMFKSIEMDIKKLGTASTRIPRGLKTSNGKEIKYLVIDTYDTLQQLLITAYIEQKSNGVNMNKIIAPSLEQRDWGVLKNYQTPMIMALKALRIPVVFVMHTTEKKDPKYNSSDSLITPGAIDMTVAGAVREMIMNNLAYGLYLQQTPEGVQAVTKPNVRVEGYDIKITKDGGSLWGGKPIRLGWDGKSLKHKYIDLILEKHEYE